MHVLLVTNRRSGSAQLVDPAAVLVERGCVVTHADIEDALRWSRAEPPATLRGVERVIVAGGDGSIGCAAVLASRLGVPLGVVPAGTANDFARAMGLPEDLEQATVLAATGDELREIDLARVDGTPFVNVASLGIAPHAAEQAEQFKRGLRSLAYPLGAAIAAIRTRPVSLVARVDDELVWSGRAWQAMLASSGAFGGWATTGDVHHGDGKLDLVVVPAGRGTRRLAVDAAALVRGELTDREGVFHERGARIELVLRHARRMVVDGEVVRVDDRHVVATVDETPVRVVVG